MEYISPGGVSLQRLLVMVTTLMCLLSVGTTDTHRQRQKYSPQIRRNNRPTHHTRYQAGRPDLHPSRPRPDLYHQGRQRERYQGRQGGPNYRYGNFNYYDYEDSTVALSPEFLNTEANVTVVEGRMATLPCSVRYLGTKEVAWARHGAGENDFLTIGKIRWSQDNRINVSYRMDENQIIYYDLQIKNVNKSYEGDYECQIIDKSPVKTLVHLKVKPRPPPRPAVSMKGEEFVDRGQKILLVCNATGPRIPEKIDWFKDGTKLDDMSYRHENLIIKEYIDVEDQALISELEIKHTDIKNSGTYICRSSDKKIDSLKVTVLVADTTNKKRETDAHEEQQGKRPHDGYEARSGEEGLKDGATRLVISPLSLVLVAVVSTVLTHWHRASIQSFFS